MEKMAHTILPKRLLTSLSLMLVLFLASCSSEQKLQSSHVPGGDEFTVVSSPDIQKSQFMEPVQGRDAEAISMNEERTPYLEGPHLKENKNRTGSKEQSPKTRRSKDKIETTAGTVLKAPVRLAQKVQHITPSEGKAAAQDTGYLYVAIVLIIVGLIVSVLFDFIGLGIIGVVIMLIGLIFLLFWLVAFIDANA
ncbi:MAG: hypothetical protein WD077_12550 [Bacteroidia bacterium]